MLNQLIDELFSVSPISSSLEGMSLVSESSSRSMELEWPQEVIGLLKVRTDCINLIDKIFNTNNSMFSQDLLNDTVRCKRNSLLVDLSVTSLVDQFSDGFSWWVSEGYVGLNSSQEVYWGLVDSDEGSVVQLSQSQKSQDSYWSWIQFVHTSDSHNKG